MTTTALVTGAGAGTGREFTRLLLRDGLRVVAVSLLEDELGTLRDELDPGDDRLVTLQLDLSRPDAARDVLTFCDERELQVDVLVNNAGFAIYGDPTEVDLARLNAMLHLNVVATTELAVLIGGRMRARGAGTILIMGSSAGFAPTARLAAYNASKAYTNLFAYGLAAALEPSGVRVTCVAPGTFKSKFMDTSGISSFAGKSGLRWLYRFERMDAADVAERAYQAMHDERAAVTIGAKAKSAKAIVRLVGPLAFARMTRSV